MTAFDLAGRYAGIGELAGKDHHPLIQWWLSLCSLGYDAPDETAWCSAFVNGIAWELRLVRSKSAAARSWLTVGEAVPLAEARTGYDVVIIKRGTSHGPEVTTGAPGHVGFFAGIEGDRVLMLSGNQGNKVSILGFPVADVLGVRRLRALGSLV